MFQSAFLQNAQVKVSGTVAHNYSVGVFPQVTEEVQQELLLIILLEYLFDS